MNKIFTCAVRRALVQRFVVMFCVSLLSVGVYAQAPGPITGPNHVCVGMNIVLSDATAGGTWMSLNPAVATVDAIHGTTNGVAGGTVTIRYSTAGGSVNTNITVYTALPIMPTGDPRVCLRQSILLTNTTPGGGTWTTSNSSVATITGAYAQGINVNGGGIGSVNITYTATNGGCRAIKTVVVDPIAQILGSMSVCAGQPVELASTIAGGTWSTNAGAIATIDPASGELMGRTAGQVTIKYTLATGCATASVVTVNPLLPITGNSPTMCSNRQMVLNNMTPGGGVWSSSNTHIATVTTNLSSSTTVTGVHYGETDIIFRTGAGCETRRSDLPVLQSPVIQSSMQSTTICQGRDGQMYPDVRGGAWTSTNQNILYIDGDRGNILAQSAGVVTIKYTLSNGCYTSSVMTVYGIERTQPEQPLVCKDMPTLLTNNTPGGGTWYNQDTARVTMVQLSSSTARITGKRPGGASIIFTSAANGCQSFRNVFVNPTEPIAFYQPVLCQGQPAQVYIPVSGGTWTTTTPSLININDRGDIDALNPGTATIKYTYSSGCVTTSVVTVAAFARSLPLGLISVCQGSSAIITNNSPGGTWMSDRVEVATVSSIYGATVRVFGAHEGPATIYFNTPYCRSISYVSVFANATISGPTSVCVGSSIQLSNNDRQAGTWSTSAAAIATVNAETGTVTGINAGNVVIKYTSDNPASCATTVTITVKPVQATTGQNSICQGQNLTLTNNTPGGGTWSHSGNTVSLLGATNLTSQTLFGTNAGTTIVTYTTNGGCATTKTVTVSAARPIIAPASVCMGTTVMLSNSIAGGTWVTGAGALATVNLTTGLMVARAMGNVTIYYLLPGGCQTTVVIPITPLFATTGGTQAMCAGQAMTLNNTTPPGGTWSSSNAAVASVASSTLTAASIRGTGAGVATITFSATANGCYATRTVTVNACRMADTSVTTEVSLADVTSNNDVRIFPNPNNGAFSLQGQLPMTTNEAVMIAITDVTGHVVYNNTITAKNGLINEQIAPGVTLVSGMYILSMRWADGRKVYHFAVQH